MAGYYPKREVMDAMNKLRTTALTALRNAIAALIGYPPANVGGLLSPRLGG